MNPQFVLSQIKKYALVMLYTIMLTMSGKNGKMRKKEQGKKVGGKCKCDLKSVFTAIVEKQRLIDEGNADTVTAIEVISQFGKFYLNKVFIFQDPFK